MSLWTPVVYRLCRHLVIGPVLYLLGRPQVTGREHIPRRGPVILAANHLAVLDSFYLTLAARRHVAFLAKREYFDRSGILGWTQRMFFRAVGQIDVDRRGGSASSTALDAAMSILADGGAWGIHPEGTRSPDGRLYRGRTGAVRVAMETCAPLIPVAITGTRPGSRPWWRRRVRIEILEPVDLEQYRDTGADGVRAATDDIMRTIAITTGQQIVNGYAREWRSHSERSDAA
ncbi:lysophospholipid acyltransferase family protein [Gordonia aichiensis]|uniref:lysophospholipid acyltransferase family protein n=1 Tax=Gordonia aichiensis TaxID=36820 RepID=UPI00058DED85|nr:lysophospholipid acyltransferase family protein [Gordonia aichiensis]